MPSACGVIGQEPVLARRCLGRECGVVGIAGKAAGDPSARVSWRTQKTPGISGFPSRACRTCPRTVPAGWAVRSSPTSSWDVRSETEGGAAVTSRNTATLGHVRRTLRSSSVKTGVGLEEVPAARVPPSPGGDAAGRCCFPNRGRLVQRLVAPSGDRSPVVAGVRDV